MTGNDLPFPERGDRVGPSMTLPEEAVVVVTAGGGVGRWKLKKLIGIDTKRAVLRAGSGIEARKLILVIKE